MGTAAPASAAPAVGWGEGSVWAADDGLTALYAAHYRPLVRLAALLLHDVGVAEEVVQDAFVATYRRGWLFEADARALPYLRKAVLNGARSALRRQATARRLDIDRYAAPPAGTAPSAEAGALASLDRTAVLAAIRSLPTRQSEAILLRYYADLSEADIAAAMGISRGAVKSHTSRGVAALRRSLETQ